MSTDEGSKSLLEAVEKTRTTAKWILSVLGAAAGAVLVGSTLADVGNADSPVRKALAIVGALGVSGGIAAAIFAVARVLAPIAIVDDKAKLRSAFRDPLVEAAVVADPTLLSGIATSLERFREIYQDALVALRKAQLEATNAAGLQVAQDRLKDIGPIAQYLRDLAIYEHCRARYNRSIYVLAWSVAGVILGSIAFSFGVAE